MNVARGVNIKYILLGLALMVLAPIAPAQESGDMRSGETAQETVESGPEERQSNGDDESDQQKPTPDQLRRKELGQAFQEFSPSEEISADNAVPFPTDI